VSLCSEELRGITKSTAEISFQSSFFVGDSIVARPHLLFHFFFSIFSFSLNLKVFDQDMNRANANK
jgi:hypothetical protein